MSGSTSSKSLRSIPQGAPGVASSMKRPNSGWKTGAVLPSLLCWPRARSGTPPPCFSSSASLAKASRMSACRSESLTFSFSSSKATTRYSIFGQVSTITPEGTPALTIPRHPRAMHHAPCPWHYSRLQVVAKAKIRCRAYALFVALTYLLFPSLRDRMSAFFSSLGLSAFRRLDVSSSASARSSRFHLCGNGSPSALARAVSFAAEVKLARGRRR